MAALHRFARSVRYALAGLWYILRHETNFQIELLAALVVVILMIVTPLRTIEYIVLTGAIFSVLIMEIINTVFERMVDVLKPRVHPYAKTMKDMMAAAVLLSAILSVILGILIFWPYFKGLM